MLFYLAAYAVTNLGAFGVLAALSTNDRPHDEVRDFAGLWHERPGMAALLTVFLLSLGGFPPTVGFIAKWYIFNAAVQQGLIALAVLGVLTSVVSVFFYLRIVVMMYMTDDKAPGHAARGAADGRGHRPRAGAARGVLPRRAARPDPDARQELGRRDLLACLA